MKAAMPFALVLPLLVITSGTQARDRDYGIGVAPAKPSPRVVTVTPVIRRPVIVTTHHQPAFPVTTPARTAPLRLSSEVNGPYASGTGQWTPTQSLGAPVNTGWGWRRAELSELVEMSRRNKAAKEETP